MQARAPLLLFALSLCQCSEGADANPDTETDSGDAGPSSGSSSGGSSSGGSSSGGSGGTSVGAAGDSSASGGSAASSNWLDEPTAMPDTLSATGLYPDLSDLSVYNERAILYRPEHALWTNGSLKQRFVVVPENSAIDIEDRESWQFPEATLFFKTFSYVDESATDGLRPIETRVLKRTPDGWEYHAYLWADDRSDAQLLDGVHTTPVEVEYEGQTFEHVVPARLDCRKCHESQPVGVIGFDELRLNAPLREGDASSQLEAFAEAGLLSDLPADPDRIVHDDATTAQVLGYLHGNCAHCHNGWTGPSSAFDMRHPVALENLIDVETTSELLSGTRLVPGSRDDSALYRALTRDETLEATAAMPPVGVDLVDRDALDLIGDWIDGLQAE